MKEVAPMKRILLLVTVALVMAAMMVATAAPALGIPPNCERGQAQAASNAPQGDLVDQHQENLSDCQQGLPPGEGHDK
jgi:hypothetical protein